MADREKQDHSAEERKPGEDRNVADIPAVEPASADQVRGGMFTIHQKEGPYKK